MGSKLKVEEFPDLVAIKEYEFREGDHRQRGGSGLESHWKLLKELLHRAADNKTKMKDVLALSPEDFTISLLTCFNDTQNFRKGALKGTCHHEGKGVNACMSLHKAPHTVLVKEKEININLTSANVNYVLDQALKQPNKLKNLMAFRTDDEKALSGGSNKNFERATHLLCEIHLRKKH